MKSAEEHKMNANYIQQHNIIQRYLHGKLTPEETVEFEECFLDKPELLEQLEMDSVLVEHLPKINLAKKQTRIANFWRGLFSTPLRASLATGLACMMFVLLLFPLVQQPAPLGNIELFYLSNVRSANSIQQQDIEFAQSANTLIFVLLTEVENTESYIVTLTNSDTGQVIALTERYMSSDIGEIYVPVKTSNLVKGNYLFEYFPLSNVAKKQRSSVRIK